MHTPATSDPDPATMVDLPYLPPKRRFVLLALALTFIVFAFCMSVLVYRGMTASDPRAVIYVNGNENWQGTTITIEGGPLKRPLVAKLEEYNKYQVPFFLTPGEYRGSVQHGEFTELIRPFVIIRDGTQMELRLPAKVPTTQTSR